MHGMKSNTGRDISDFIRVGQVTEVNPLNCSCRVAYDDLQDDGTPMTSEPLQIVQHRTVKCQNYTMPEIGEHVLCIFLPNGNQEGFVIGSYYTAQNLPTYPLGSEALYGQQGVYRQTFDDRTIIEYDLNRSKARIYAPNGYVDIEECIDLTANAKRNISLKADGNITIKSGGDMLIESGSHLTLKAPRIDENP